jgi:hypothetical protein
MRRFKALGLPKRCVRYAVASLCTITSSTCGTDLITLPSRAGLDRRVQLAVRASKR